jgi:hypothetical protein
MINRASGKDFSCDCCDWSRGKRSQKAVENKQWQEEAWLESLEHHGSDCPYDSHGCIECWDIDHDDAYDNSDLDDIPGVWSDHDWRKNLTEADYWFMERMDERITDARKRREIEQAWEEHTQNRDSGTGSVRAAG